MSWSNVRDRTGELVRKLKDRFDTKYGGCWHCLVGENIDVAIDEDSKFLVKAYRSDTRMVIVFQVNEATG